MIGWYYVDGVLRRFTGDHDDIVDRVREMRADGHTVRSARAPRPSPRDAERAAQHRRRR